MKKFFGDFLSLFADSATVICLILTSFLLLLNVYHSREIRNDYYKDFSTDTQYLKYQETLKKARANFDSVNVNKVGGNDVSFATTGKNVFNECYTAIEKSAFHSLGSKKSVSVKDIYQYNTEMYEVLNNKCFFNLKYNYENISKNYTNKKQDFVNIANHLETERVNVMASTDFMNSELESNSAYYFMTDLTRNSIYNRNAENLSFTIKNYLVLSQSLLEVSNWYVSEFGGNR